MHAHIDLNSRREMGVVKAIQCKSTLASEKLRDLYFWIGKSKKMSVGKASCIA